MFGLPDFVAIGHDLRTGRWHPVNYEVHDLPGGFQPVGGKRVKSRGHHTEGFATEAEAVAFLDDIDARCVADGGSKPVRMDPLVFETETTEEDATAAFVSVVLVADDGRCG